MASPLVSIHGLTKVYRMGDVTLHALKGVDLQILAGDFVAISGPSGSGKSTLMNILGCLDRPTSGTYLLEGKAVDAMNKDELAYIRNQRLGFVFQSFNLLSRTTALENVELPLVYRQGISRRVMKEKAMNALCLVGLEQRIHHHPNQLSGGQQQRVAIARSLVNDPAVILADEPTGNLDTRTSIEIMALFQALSQKGITILLVTHEPDIAQFAKRQLIVRDGLLVVDSLNKNPRDASQALTLLPPSDLES